MTRQHKQQREFAIPRRPLCGAILLAMASLANAQNLPTGESGLSGIESVVRDGNTMTINQSARAARLNWATFSIGADNTVRFVQPDATSIALNRVLGDQASVIQGVLQANGRVFLVNPNGVLFGASAMVDVGGLVASTLDISDDEFMSGLDSGRFRFSIDGGTAADITNLGSLAARASGTIALLGGIVENAGSIVADGGTVALASSREVTLDFFGDGLTQVSVGLGSDDGGIVNSGLLQADGGNVQLRTQTYDGEPDGASGYITHLGVVRARTLGMREGRIVLDAGSGTVAIGFDSDASTGATLDATGLEAGQQGGDIDIVGDTIQVGGANLLAGACIAADSCTLIDASGHAGGGNISMGSTFGTAIFGLNAFGLAGPAVRILSDATHSGVGGSIALDNAGVLRGDVQGFVSTQGAVDLSATGRGAARGGTIAISGGSGGVAAVTFPGSGDILASSSPRFDADGNTGGGSIDLQSDGVVVVDNGITLSADALESGNGGQIRAIGGSGLRAFGDFSVRGGATGGDGGFIETSGGGVDLRGIGIDASAANGAAGAWLIDPYDVQIQAGTASGSLPSNPFEPVASSIVQDGDINNALNAGTSVRITTGDVAAGNPGDGNITIQPNVAIARTNGTAPLTFQLDANRAITGSGFSIDAGDGPLNVLFNSDANGTGILGSGDVEIRLSDISVTTNGGTFWLYGRGDPATGSAGPIAIYRSLIDTRGVGSSFGEVRMRGWRAGFDMVAGVGLFGTTILAGAGGIDIAGRSTSSSSGHGVFVGGDNGIASLLSSEGDISIGGVVQFGDTSGATMRGVAIEEATVSSEGGNVDISGRVASTTTYLNRSTAVYIGEDGQVGGGNTARVRIVGESITNGNHAGIDLGSEDGCGLSGGACVIGQDVVLQASVSTGPDAFDFEGGVQASRVVNLRPGGVDVDGAVYERTADTISLGGGTGFTLDEDLLGLIDAPDVVIGSDAHTGLIQVLSATARAGNLTLQSGGAGAAGIRLDAGLDVGDDTLALLSAGNISQGAAGSINAESLLVDSGGEVQLGAASNDVGGTTLAGSAGGDFSFVDVDAVAIGSVDAVGFDAGSNAAQSIGSNGVQAGGDVFIRTLAGNLTLAAGIGAGNDIELVTAGTLQNVGGVGLSAGGAWTVWASTWTGETRGGLAGSGTLPNLYGCTFQGSCVVSVPTTGNRFIYTQRPVAVVDIDDASRAYGADNPAFGFTVSGMILGDQAANAISGNPSTTATPASDAGLYAIDGSFASPAGYLVTVLPGILDIGRAVLVYVANPYSRVYGDPEGTPTGTVTGLVNGDTLASATTGSLVFVSSTNATSPVGSYAITGTGLSSTNYIFAQAPGNATAYRIDPATLLYVADPYTRFVGQPNGPLAGSVTGFRNGETIDSATTGTLAFTTTAGLFSPVGTYAIDGSGLSAGNYVFEQAPGNATALEVLGRITPATTLDQVRDPLNNYLYDRNLGAAPMCMASTDLVRGGQDQEGDVLAREWAKVKTRPNLTNCVASNRRNGCDDF